VERINAKAREAGADGVVMTQKDAVKIPCTATTAGWRFLLIQSRVTRGEEDYAGALKGALDGAGRDVSRAS
jgi:tetraacyldisaccharide-1-P 4'-kinase